MRIIDADKLAESVNGMKSNVDWSYAAIAQGESNAFSQVLKKVESKAVEVPDRDALLAVATTIECESMPYGIFGDDMIDDWHGKRKTVATFLRTIAGDKGE